MNGSIEKPKNRNNLKQHTENSIIWRLDVCME